MSQNIIAIYANFHYSLLLQNFNPKNGKFKINYHVALHVTYPKKTELDFNPIKIVNTFKTTSSQSNIA